MTNPRSESAMSLADLELFRLIGAIVAIHGMDPGHARPNATLPVLWFGVDEPTGMVEGDVFVQVTSVA